MINVNNLLWVSIDLMALVLLVRGIQQRCHFLYPAFYLFLAIFLLSSAIKSATFLAYGRASEIYYYSYYLTAQAYPILRVAILWDVRARLPVKERILKGDYLAAGFLLSLLSFSIYVKLIQQPFTVLFAILCFAAPIVAAIFVLIARSILRVRDRVLFGQNVKGILLGVGLLTLATTVNYERLYILRSPDVYAFIEQFGTFLVEAIWIATLWERDPPQLRGEKAGWQEKSENGDN